MRVGWRHEGGMANCLLWRVQRAGLASDERQQETRALSRGGEAGVVSFRTCLYFLLGNGYVIQTAVAGQGIRRKVRAERSREGTEESQQQHRPQAATEPTPP